MRAERTALQLVLPRYLRPQREKIFRAGALPPPRRQRQGPPLGRGGGLQQRESGPLTWATLRVLRALLWRFHGADGGGRCFPSYERIASAAKCHRDSVCVALKGLEDAGLLTWVHRLVKVRHRESDLFGHWGSEWRVHRTSNGYRLLDPLDCDPGRRGYKSENPSRPQNRDLKNNGARLDGARVMHKAPSQAPPEQTTPPAIAFQREHAAQDGARLSAAERAELIARLDTRPTSEDWALWNRDLDTRIDRN
jgi:hypothetical protein